MHGVDLYDFHQSLGIQRLGLKCRNEGFSFSENPSGFEKVWFFTSHEWLIFFIFFYGIK